MVLSEIRRAYSPLPMPSDRAIMNRRSSILMTEWVSPLAGFARLCQRGYAESRVEIGFLVQNAAEFILAERQAFGNDQGHPQDMGRDCRDLFDVRFSERDQGKGDIVVVARYQYFRTDDSRF